MTSTIQPPERLAEGSDSLPASGSAVGCGDWLACRAKTMRELANLTRTKAAKKLGVSVSLVSLWESGKRTISTAQVMQMADAYGISLDFFLNATVIPKFKLPK